VAGGRNIRKSNRFLFGEVRGTKESSNGTNKIFFMARLRFIFWKISFEKTLIRISTSLGEAVEKSFLSNFWMKI